MTLEAPTEPPVARLSQRLGHLIHLPGSARYDELRMPWNVAVDQRPAAVALPTTPEDVSAVVRAAAELGIRIAPQSSGHGAAMATVAGLNDALLLRTTQFTGVTIDPERRIARIGSGAIWDDVVNAAAAHGLAALHGSSPNVSVVGFALGGGIGWYGRKHGIATNSITAVDLVLADGSYVRADATQNTDLFWALRGGGGNFGVVTALEMRLFPVPDAVAGMMLWDISAAEPVLRRWVDWARTAPDEVTTSFQIMRLPEMEGMPPFLNGRSLVMIDGGVLTDDDTAAALLAPLRELQPEMDTFARVPAPALARIHMDPEDPVPFAGGTVMLTDMDEDAVVMFLDRFGPEASTGLLMAEIRQLGGAFGRPAPDAGALSHLDGGFLFGLIGMVSTPESAAAIVAESAEAVLAFTPWASGSAYLNFADGGAVDSKVGYGADAWARLLELRRKYDPNEVFMANHPIR
ncbi:FAD-binding oxidoreductase [Lysobacter korlensis]|uniref:FAD-binding oxidoreductase n=1 Tax=Lysobacter korlensis TaxID=553636 RepID=A0ABV6RXS9_9GAMM